MDDGEVTFRLWTESPCMQSHANPATGDRCALEAPAGGPVPVILASGDRSFAVDCVCGRLGVPFTGGAWEEFGELRVAEQVAMARLLTASEALAALKCDAMRAGLPMRAGEGSATAGR